MKVRKNIMGFVREKVSKDDWGIYKSFVGKNANKYTSWILNKERKIYFIETNSLVREQIEEYVLIWEGKKIYFSIYVFIRETENGDKILHWDIKKIVSTNYFKEREDELIDIITDIAQCDEKNRKILVYIANPEYKEEYAI